MVGVIPFGRDGLAEKGARVAVFLLLDAASYLTGVNLEVSGVSA